MSTSSSAPPPPQAGDDALRMAIVDKVQRLEELQAHEVDARRRTARRAWLFVLLAGVVLSIIVAALGSMIAAKRTELATLETRALAEKQNLDRLEARVAELKQREQALNSALSKLPKAQLEAAVDSAWSGQEPPALWVPRAYIQIVDEGDRAWANDVARRLREQGLIVPGIELVTAARALRRTDVRYYRKADQQAAQAIVDRLAAMGVPAVLNYLSRYEDSNTVRPNNFEIWFAAGVRELPVR
ncbi:MAG: hypothetical protein K2W80_18715 [Burkholderiales bacterium]|nr:hypothetical protein [Burkholderiales bacterium]